MQKLGFFINSDDDTVTYAPLGNGHVDRLNGTRSFERRRKNRKEMSSCSLCDFTNSQSWLPSEFEGRLKKELKYFFSSPCDKYRARKRKPYKLCIQIIKIALVTAQLVVFGQSNQYVSGFMNDVASNIRHNLLLPTTEMYTIDSLYEQIDHMRYQYSMLTNESLGLYKYASFEGSGCATSNISTYGNHLICLCLVEYGDLDVLNSSFLFSYKSKQSFCAALKPWSKRDQPDNTSRSLPLLNGTLYQINPRRLISMKFHFGLWTTLLENLFDPEQSDCFKMLNTVNFDNKLHSGKITRGLNTTFHRVYCHDGKDKLLMNGNLICIFVLDLCIILTCCSSVLLCCRSLWRGQRLRRSFEKFYYVKHKKRLTVWDKSEFFNGWYFLIIISDGLTTAGTVSKIVIDFKWTGVANYDACSLFLGLGCLCVWIGVLRYVGYFHQYNILVLTLKKSLPHVLRFMVCASIMYLGFMFCGWVVLGPYHHKFRNPVVTSEALFSLLNGDDMYMTFEEMSHSSPLTWTFSQIYLYVFISLFIYIVLSLFIAVIMETYETIKSGSPPLSEVQKFLNENSDDTDDGYVTADTYCCCCFYHNDHPDIPITIESDDDLLIS